MIMVFLMVKRSKGIPVDCHIWPSSCIGGIWWLWWQWWWCLLLFILRVFWRNHVDGNANIVLSFWKAVRLTKDNILGRFVSIIMIHIFIRPIAKLRHVRPLLLEFRRQSGNMSFLGHVQEGVASEKWSQWSYFRAVDGRIDDKRSLWWFFLW